MWRLTCLLLCPIACGGLLSAQERARLVILADMGNEPDEMQQMAHMLVCSNAFDLEGLIAVTGKFLHPDRDDEYKRKVHPEHFLELIDAYEEVLPNLPPPRAALAGAAILAIYHQVRPAGLRDRRCRRGKNQRRCAAPARRPRQGRRPSDLGRRQRGFEHAGTSALRAQDDALRCGAARGRRQASGLRKRRARQCRGMDCQRVSDDPLDPQQLSDLRLRWTRRTIRRRRRRARPTPVETLRVLGGRAAHMAGPNMFRTVMALSAKYSQTVGSTTDG